MCPPSLDLAIFQTIEDVLKPCNPLQPSLICLVLRRPALAQYLGQGELRRA
jgi:hypothetical protein